jgi:hypothetical protein
LKTGIKLNYSEGKMDWFDCSIPLRPPGGLDTKEFHAMGDMFFVQTEDELFGEDWLDCYATEILDTQYEWRDVTDVVNQLTHLNTKQKADLLSDYMILSRCSMEDLGLIHIARYT